MTSKFKFNDDDGRLNLRSRILFKKYKKDLHKARSLAKQIGYGYMGNKALEKDSIHEAFCYYKTQLGKLEHNNKSMSLDYSVSCLINTITLHVILKAFDMGA